MRDSKIVLRRALIFGALAFGAMFNNSMIVAQVITAKQPYQVSMDVVLKLLSLPDVQKELELESEQLGTIKALTNEYPQEVQRELSKMQPLPVVRDEKLDKDQSDEDLADEALKELSEARNQTKLEIGKAYAEKLDEVLLPFQRKRIGQIGIQFLHAKPVFVSTFKSKAVAVQAELTEREADKLSQATEDAEKEYLRELRELKKKYHKQVRDSLAPEVKAAVQEILGDPYITVPEIKKKK